MSSGGKGKMPNVASFIKENFNIVGNSILVMVLLGLEKIMDLEFRCPADKPLAIVYSLVFFAVPTAIVLVVACYISTGGKCSNTATGGNGAEIKGGTEEAESGGCCANIKSRVFVIKVVVIWVLIVMTDGRYGDCLVKSVDELKEIKNSNTSHISPLKWTEVRDNYLIHLFQIIGLLLILVAIIVACFCESKINSCLQLFGCKFESESEKSRRKNEENLLQITEDTLQKQARQRQEEFVVTLLRREDWASYDPGSPNALEELGNITAKWKEEVKRQLK